MLLRRGTIDGMDAKPTWFWKLALAVSAAIWGGAFVVVKGALDDISPAWLLALRFALTTVILCAVFRRTLREHLDADHLRTGALLGLFSGAAFLAQYVGLADTTPGRSAFLTATYVVFVPLLNWAVARRRPAGVHIAAAMLALAGVGFISLAEGLSFSLSWGDLVTLVCAVLFALHIVYVARFSEGRDIMTLTIVQIGFSTVVALVWAIAFEPVPDLAAAGGGFWAAFGYIVIMSSCIAMVVQNVGQSIVEPATAALLLSLESVFAVIFSVVFYHEVLTPRVIVGFALIFAAVLVSEVLPSFLDKPAE